MSHNRLILRGTLYSSERWSVNLSYKGIVPANPDFDLNTYEELSGWADDAADVLGTGQDISELRRLLGAYGNISSIRTEYVTSAGTVGAAAEKQLVPITGTTGGTSPSQTSVVFSFRTGRPGRSYRGRVYWPAAGASIASLGTVASTISLSNAAGQLAALYKDMGRRSLDADLQPVVWSKALSVVTPVTQVSVNDIPDTQRRRANELSGTTWVSAMPS